MISVKFKYRLYKFSNLFIKDNLFQKMLYTYHYLKEKRFYGFPNLKNPKTFNEKTLWLKQNYRDKLGMIVADKYKVRNYVEKKIGSKYLIPLINIYKDEKEINIGTLPKRFVLKPNHGSGWIIICRDKVKISEKYVKNICKDWLKMNYYYISREWQYKNIEPKIILCEEYLSPKENEELKDYKIFCFNGNPKYVQIDVDRFTNHKRCFYDTNWKKLPFTTLYPKANRDIPKPSKLNEMLLISKKLSENFIFSRIDLYYPKNKVFFGEITLHHGGGYEPFFPQYYDLILGKDLSLPK